MKLFQFLLFSVTNILIFVSCTNNAVKPEQKQDSVNEIKEVALGINQIAEWSTELKGKRVVVVSNQTSVLNGVHLVDTLLRVGVNLICVFAPEHGFR